MKYTGKERRRWKRFFITIKDCLCHCFAYDEQGREMRIRVVDISLGGARIEILDAMAEDGGPDFVVQQDSVLRFTACALESWGQYMEGVAGSVCWTDGNKARVLFENPLGMKEPAAA